MRGKLFIVLSMTSRLLVRYNPDTITIANLARIPIIATLHIDGVACWRSEKGKLIVEVEYVGSREKAPY